MSRANSDRHAGPVVDREDAEALHEEIGRLPERYQTPVVLCDLQGLARTDRPAFSFQGHPEASPGPHDLKPLFERFNHLMLRRLQAQLKVSEENLRRQKAGGR